MRRLTIDDDVPQRPRKSRYRGGVYPFGIHQGPVDKCIVRTEHERVTVQYVKRFLIHDLLDFDFG